MAAEYVKMGYLIGVGGVVTFKNGRKLHEVVRKIPLENIVVETDCPYLSPVPFRGKRCDSSMIMMTAERIAEIKGISVEDVLRVTAENACRMYGIVL